ncbi:hypothetical protein DsansV1_C04g0037141 [Dioscorea sansibarensis]
MNISKGEELRKQIGAAAYIECSSKTQQLFLVLQLRWFCDLHKGRRSPRKSVEEDPVAHYCKFMPFAINAILLLSC